MTTLHTSMVHNLYTDNSTTYKLRVSEIYSLNISDFLQGQINKKCQWFFHIAHYTLGFWGKCDGSMKKITMMSAESSHWVREFCMFDL